MTTGLSEELFGSLMESLYAVPADRRVPGTRWVMNAEWWRECRNMTGADGRTLWVPSLSVSGPELLLGLPVEIREDGGVPHLEPS